MNLKNQQKSDRVRYMLIEKQLMQRLNVEQASERLDIDNQFPRYVFPSTEEHAAGRCRHPRRETAAPVQLTRHVGFFKTSFESNRQLTVVQGRLMRNVWQTDCVACGVLCDADRCANKLHRVAATSSLACLPFSLTLITIRLWCVRYRPMKNAVGC